MAYDYQAIRRDNERLVRDRHRPHRADAAGRSLRTTERTFFSSSCRTRRTRLRAATIGRDRAP